MLVVEIELTSVAKYPFLADFNTSAIDKARIKSNVGTIVSKRYANIKATPISALLKVLEDPAKYEHQRFVVSGYFLNFSSTKVTEIVKKMANGKPVNFGDRTNDDKASYIFHFIGNMKDTSVEEDNRTLTVYFLTNEEDQHLFDLWELLPSQSEPSKWKGLPKATIDKFEKRLEQLTTEDMEVKLVVELLITNTGKAFFKVYETVFV